MGTFYSVKLKNTAQSFNIWPTLQIAQNIYK